MLVLFQRRVRHFNSRSLRQVSGLDASIAEQRVLDVFVTFGDVVDIQMPREVARDGKGELARP